jgi:cell division protein FtsB
MATRRPKVPRVTPATRQPETDAAGGDVIQADFGGHRPAGAVREAGTRNTSAGEKGVASTAAAGKAATAASAAAVGKAAASGSGSPKEPGKNGSKSAASADSGADENLDPIPAKAFSGRMLALAVVMIAITIMLAPTVKIFIDKRAEIAALEADIAASKADQDDLKRQVSRWQDPNYVKQQARDRINMVMPGETGYWVFGSDLPAGESAGPPGAAAKDPANLPWVDSLWESIRRSATD